MLVLLLTLLIVDRMIRMRELKSQSRAIAGQAAVIIGQADRTADAIARTSPSARDHEEAYDELRTYTQMMFISAPLLIDAKVPRTFLETAQRVAGRMYRALQTGDADRERAKAQLDGTVKQLREAASPLLQVLVARSALP